MSEAHRKPRLPDGICIYQSATFMGAPTNSQRCSLQSTITYPVFNLGGQYRCFWATTSTEDRHRAK